MKKTIILGMYGLTVLMLGACTKAKDGAPGAQGPQGNANIQTAIFTTSDWTLNNSYWYSKDYNLINVNNNAAIMVYWNTTGTEYIALPITVNDVEVYFKTNASGFVEIDVRSASGNTTIANPGSSTFKIVVIPPAMKKLNPNLDFRNYEAVKSAFSLKN